MNQSGETKQKMGRVFPKRIDGFFNAREEDSTNRESGRLRQSIQEMVANFVE